jgi:hypothetical protein
MQNETVLGNTFSNTVSLCTVHDTHTNRTVIICGHTTELFYNEIFLTEANIVT